MTPVEHIARKDISDYVQNELHDIFTYYEGNNIDVWVVFGKHLFTREQRSLNRELGVNSINYIGNNNGQHTRFKKKCHKYPTCRSYEK